MQLYQLLDKGPTIPAGSYVVLQHTWKFPNSQKTFITIALASDQKVVNTIKEVPIGSLAPVTWKPQLCRYLVDYMGVTEEADYHDDIVDPDEGTDRFWCTVDLNHPQCPQDSIEDELIEYWNTGKKPIYVIAKH